MPKKNSRFVYEASDELPIVADEVSKEQVKSGMSPDRGDWQFTARSKAKPSE